MSLRHRVFAFAVASLFVGLAAPAPAAPSRHPPPMLLPGDASGASVRTADGRWIVGARQTLATFALARSVGARQVGPLGAWVVPVRNARGFANSLQARGLLTYAEPDVATARRSTAATDPLASFLFWRRQVARDLIEPPVTSQSPLLALVDSQLDVTHPEFAGSNISAANTGTPTDEHGTATASVAAAPRNGVGIEGIWPGMRAVNVSSELTCDGLAGAIVRAVKLRARVINMSFGGSFCFTVYSAIQLAVGAQILPVASSGNEFEDGNPVEYPASLPHVLTIAATNPDLTSSYFSSAGNSVDLSAPGRDILSAVPAAFDTDGPRDGYASLDGTSFSAPIASAAAAWIMARRPGLNGAQIADAMRSSAIDLGPTGYDPNFGYGFVDIAGAIAAPTPARDPLEPNDDVPFINGSVFRGADPPIFSGAARSLSASVDQIEDPDDVYRIRVPARSRARIDLRTSLGDADLAVLDLGTRSVARPRGHLLGYSNHNGRALDRVTLTNRAHGVRSAYVHVYIDSHVRTLNANYRLSVRRVR